MLSQSQLSPCFVLFCFVFLMAVVKLYLVLKRKNYKKDYQHWQVLITNNIIYFKKKSIFLKKNEKKL